LEGNGCITDRAYLCGVSWNLRDLFDYFLWGFVKYNVYFSPLPKTLPELRERINSAIGNVTQDMLEWVWREWKYRLDMVVRGDLNVTRHKTPIHNVLSTAPQLSISQKALGTLPEDGNGMPKCVEATKHN
jgi:hypothetical protein